MVTKLSLTGFALLLALTLAVLVTAAPWIATHDPATIDPLIRLQSASSQHWMGTDTLGRDVLSRALWGGRYSVMIGACVALLATLVGLVLGLTAGLVRPVDGWIMRTMDGLMAIPGVLLAIALTAFMRPDLTSIIVAITVPEVPKVARLARALVLQLRETAFVEAARAVGTPLPTVVTRHILPQMVGPLMVQATFIAAWAILTEATLSFLGVGLPPQLSSWGNMMSEGRSVVGVAPHIVLWPGLLVALTVLAINLLGDSLRDALDPHMAHRSTRP